MCVDGFSCCKLLRDFQKFLNQASEDRDAIRLEQFYVKRNASKYTFVLMNE